MELSKAIEVLGTHRDEGDYDLPEDLDHALSLGIEALKRIQEQRSYRFSNMNRELPGETEGG